MLRKRSKNEKKTYLPKKIIYHESSIFFSINKITNHVNKKTLYLRQRKFEK